MLSQNLKDVQQNIAKACAISSRSVSDVRLIAVSKTKPVEMLREAYDLGVRDFGENKVQELVEKYDQLPRDIRWHMIGHLQRNKVKYIVGKVEMIHSVDSSELANEISRQSVKHSVISKILIEINIGDEESKFGVKYDETAPLAIYAASLPNIEVCGIMCVAPYVADPEDNRPHFQSMNKILIDIRAKMRDNDQSSMRELSMGMSGDYQVAVQEGATMVRVGTGIFGERDYYRTGSAENDH